MKAAFTVNRVSAHPLSVEAEFQGEKIKASVECVEVELLPVPGTNHGSLVLRFTGSEAEQAKVEYTEGSAVTLDVSAPTQ